MSYYRYMEQLTCCIYCIDNNKKIPHKISDHVNYAIAFNNQTIKSLSMSGGEYYKKYFRKISNEKHIYWLLPTYLQRLYLTHNYYDYHFYNTCCNYINNLEEIKYLSLTKLATMLGIDVRLLCSDRDTDSSALLSKCVLHSKLTLSAFFNEYGVKNKKIKLEIDRQYNWLNVRVANVYNHKDFYTKEKIIEMHKYKEAYCFEWSINNYFNNKITKVRDHAGRLYKTMRKMAMKHYKITNGMYHYYIDHGGGGLTIIRNIVLVERMTLADFFRMYGIKKNDKEIRLNCEYKHVCITPKLVQKKIAKKITYDLIDDKRNERGRRLTRNGFVLMTASEIGENAFHKKIIEDNRDEEIINNITRAN